MTERTAIDGDISDLFFNLDLAAAKVKTADGKFAGWDDKSLRAEAEWFLAALDRLGVGAPSIDDLIADFHGRC